MENDVALRPISDDEMKHIIHQDRDRCQYSVVLDGTNLSHKAGKVKNLGSAFSQKTVNIKKVLNLSKK